MTLRNYSNILTCTRVSSSFSASRFHPVLKKWRAHNGVDLAALNGTPVHTPFNGVVVDARYSESRGNFVVIQHTLPDELKGSKGSASHYFWSNATSPAH